MQKFGLVDWDHMLDSEKLLCYYIQALRKRASIYDLVGFYDQAIKDFNVALQESRHAHFTGHARIAAEMMLDLAGIFEPYRCDYRSAMRMISKTYLKFGRCDKDVYFRVLKTLGNIYERRGNYRRALANYKTMLAVSRGLKRKFETGISYNNLGVVYHDIGKVALALRYYMKSLRIFEQIGDRRRICITCNNIGIVHYDQGRYEMALKYYGKYLKISRQINYRKGMSTASGNIGLIYHNLGNTKCKLEHYHQYLAIASELGDNWEITIALANIASVYLDKHNFAAALRYYHKCINVAGKIGNKGIMGLAFLG